MSVGRRLDTYIQDEVKRILNGTKFPPDYDSIYTDTLAEIIDKLIIVHIRYWYLEDAMANAKNDEELVSLRKKSEVLFKEKRPMLVAGFDKLLFNLLKGRADYTPVNPKHYDQWENDS